MGFFPSKILYLMGLRAQQFDPVPPDQDSIRLTSEIKVEEQDIAQYNP